MRKSFICIVLILAAVFVMRGYWQRSAKEAVAFTEDNELYIEAGDLDVYFELLESFSETYMLFGGNRETHKSAFKGF
jgi:regulatory protein YycI of two-component signal transduction system YycFG